MLLFCNFLPHISQLKLVANLKLVIQIHRHQIFSQTFSELLFMVGRNNSLSI